MFTAATGQVLRSKTCIEECGGSVVGESRGLVMRYKRLEEGKFAWPKISDGVMRLSKAQFEALFEGLDWRRVTARRPRRPGATE